MENPSDFYVDPIFTYTITKTSANIKQIFDITKYFFDYFI